MGLIKFVLFCFRLSFSVRFKGKVMICLDGAFLRGVDIDNIQLTLEAVIRMENANILKDSAERKEQQLSRYKKYKKIMFSYNMNKLLSKSNKPTLKLLWYLIRYPTRTTKSLT